MAKIIKLKDYRDNDQHIKGQYAEQYDPALKFGIATEEVNGADCPFDGNITIPADGTHVTGTTCEDFKDLFFASVDPTVAIRATNISIPNSFDGGTSSIAPSSGFGWYVTGSVINVPEIEGNPSLGANPPGAFLTLDFIRVGSGIYSTTNLPIAGWNNDTTEAGAVTTDQQFSVVITDTEGRTGTASDWFRFTLPYFGTTVNITTLTPEQLASPSQSYYELHMVAEQGSNKHTADFPVLFGTCTGVEFFNTVSGAWEWMGGSPAGSLALFTQSAVTHVMDVDTSTVNYTRYTHNGVLTGAVDLRFHF